MGWGFHLQESAKHHEDHDHKESEGKKRVLRSPEGEEHDFDGSSKIPLSHFVAKFPGPTHRRSVLLYLNGLNTRSKRNVRKIENLKNEA